MRRRIFFTALIAFALISMSLSAQTEIKTIVLQGASIHTAKGNVIENGMLVMQDGKITYVGSMGNAAYKNAEVIDVKGKHIYPGLFALCNYAGLNEIDAARPTHDYAESGEMNPNVRSLVAYNCDSRILPTLLCNGIAYTQATPQGGIISGSSSLMKTVCNNWEDGYIATDAAIHINWPEFIPQSWHNEQRRTEQKKRTAAGLQKLKSFFTDAALYAASAPASAPEAKFESVRKVFAGGQKIFISASDPASVMDAALFFKSLQLSIIWVGGHDAMQIAPFLKEYKIPVIFQTIHRLPDTGHKLTDDPFTLPAALKKEGIPFCISISGSWEVRNLPFAAGTAAAYGLDKEEALAAISLYPARILGLDSLLGSLEEGKAASLLICSGDLLDMSTSKVEKVYIDGKDMPLDNNPQLQLYKKYNKKDGQN